MPVENLISMPVAAEQLHVTEAVVRRMVKRGELTPAKVQQLGRQTRRYFRSEDVEALRRRRSGEEENV